MEKKFVSAVIYLNNSEKEIIPFLNKIIPVFSNNFEHYEFIFVDDSSEDNTVCIIKDYLNKHDYKGVFSIIYMGFYQGIEAAMNAGRDISIGDFVYEFDNVLSDFKESLILEIYEKMLSGYDIVSASPNGNMRLSSKLFYKIFNGNSKANLSIETESFRIISRRAINRIKAIGTHIPYRKAVYASCGLKRSDIKYDSSLSIAERKNLLKQNGNLLQRGRVAFDYYIYFTNVMEKISLIISVIFFLFFFGTVFYSLIDYFVNGSAIEGWTSTVCFISFGFLGIFVVLTIILKYLSVLLDLIFRKQKYLVADIEKIVG